MLQNVSCFVYEADHHCRGCAVARFGLGILDRTALDLMTDREGNPIGVLYGWDERPLDEYGNSRGLTCGDCHYAIEAASPEYLAARAAGKP